MASSIVRCETTPPLPSLNEDTKGVVPVVRKMKKIKIDSSTISRILDVTSETCETCEIINNDISKVTVIMNNMNDERINNNRNNVCKGVCTEEEEQEVNEKCGYYYKNRDKKLEYQKKYNREQGDRIKNYNKDYYQKRREEILEKAKTKIICECGCEVQLFNMNSHKKTKKHARALEQRKKEL